MSRTPYVGGNWKMNLHGDEALALAQSLASATAMSGPADVVICPAFMYLSSVGDVLAKAGSLIKLGAQDFYAQPNGPFTGEVSLSMLRDVGVSVVLVGHSERRHVLGEPDTLINEKTLAALEADLEVILCVGETLEQREAGKTDAINWGQTGYGLAGVTADQMARVTIAYEPVWAIGTGMTATPGDAQNAHQAIRAFVQFGLFNESIAQSMRIMYGGSAKPANAGDLIAQPDVDGFLVGGASLVSDDFTAIVAATQGN